MSVETESLLDQLTGAIAAHGELVMTEHQIGVVRDPVELMSKGVGEWVTLSVAPLEPTRSVKRLNQLGSALDQLVMPNDGLPHRGMRPRYGSHVRNAYWSSSEGRMRLGERTYGEEMGMAHIDFGTISADLMIQRLIRLRIFPNIRLAYEASRGEILDSISRSRMARSERDFKRYGTAAVTRI